MVVRLVDLGGHGYLLGNGLPEADEFSGNSTHDLVRVFATGEQFSIALAQPHLALPSDILDDVELCFEPQL